MKHRLTASFGLSLIVAALLALPALADDFNVKQEFGQVQGRGAAQIQNPVNGPLTVSNIGSSGLDGVAFATGRGGSIGPIRWMAPEALPGRGLNVVVGAEDAAGAPSGFASSFVFDDMGGVAMHVNPMATGGTVAVVRVYDNGNPVHEAQTMIGVNPLFQGSAPPNGFGTTGPYLPIPPYDDSIFGWIFPGGTGFDLSDGTVAFGDLVTFSFSGSVPEMTLTGCEILGIEPDGSTGQLTVTDFPSTLFHHRFGSIGQAGVQMVDNLGSSGQDGVRVSGIGSSAYDGVSVALNPGDTGLGVHLNPQIATSGDVLRFGGLSLSEQPQGRTPLPKVTCSYVDSFFDIWTELSYERPSAFRFTLDGRVVDEQTAPSGPARLWAPLGEKTSVQYPYRLEMHATANGGFRVEIAFPQTMRFTTGGGIDEDCDAVELDFEAPIGGPWYDWDAIELAALLILLGEIDINGAPNGSGGWSDDPVILDAARGIEKTDIRRGADGTLIADNLGSSGQDGVRLSPPGGGTGSGFGAEWALAAPLDPHRGHVTVLKAHGGGGGGGAGGVIRVGVAPADTNGGEWGVAADFSDLGTGGVSYEIYDAGQLVDTIICAGTLEECLGLTAVPTSCEVLPGHDGRPRMRLGLPPLTRYIDKSSPVASLLPADEVVVVANDVPATPFDEVTQLDILMGNMGGGLIVTSAGTTTTTTAIDPVMPTARPMSLATPSPNPFNPRTVVAFDVVRGGEYALNVFDLRGKKIRELFSGYKPTGTYHETWDGLDDGGRAVASGTYMFQLVGNGDRQARRAVLVR